MMYLDEKLDKNILDEFLNSGDNILYAYNHIVHPADLKIFKEIKAIFDKKISVKVPAPFDNVEILSNNGYTFYKYAQLEKSDISETGWQYCENANSFYIDIDRMSTSGGAFHSIDVSKLKYKGVTTRKVWTWGSCGPCAHGGIYIDIVVNNWEYQTNEKYIPLVCGTYKNYRDIGYKYYIDTFHKTSPSFRTHKACFRTLKGFKNYLKNTGLKIGKKLTWYGAHEIIGDFDFEQHLNLKTYQEAKGEAIEFPLLSNGSYTGAFLKNGIVHFCNCNVKDRPQYPYIHE